MRFFACDARVVENCLVAFLAGDARSILEAREMDFMMGDRVIAVYGKIWVGSTMYTSLPRGGWLRVLAMNVGTRRINASSKSNDVGLERVKLKPYGKPRPTTYVIIFCCMCIYGDTSRVQ
jgi:hypothetical protein